MSTLQIKDPWSPLILQDHYDLDNWSILKSKADTLLSKVKENSYLEQGSAVSSVTLQESSDYQPHTWPEFLKFQQWISPKINEVIDRWNLTKQPYQVTNSWINRHNAGGWTEEHVHRGCQISIVYYLQVPENSGRIMFRDPLEFHWAGEPSDYRSLPDASWYPVNVRTGDVLFFPGWLPHKTEKNNSTESRYVLTVNLTGQLPLKFLV